MTTDTTTPTVVPAPASLWSNCKDLFNMTAVAVSTCTTAITAIDDLVVAAQAQTSLIKDTSIHDADFKRIELAERMTARKQLRITSLAKDSKSKS